LLDTEYLISDEPIVTATSENGVCLNSQTVQINYTSPPVHPALDTLDLCEGQSIDYTLDVSSLDNVLWWNESDSPTIAVSEAGAYTVEIYNSCGSVSDTLVVNSQVCESHVYVPTAFTPDYDGVNDVWKIEATDLKWFSARVYNRWGDVIWEASSPDKVWLGGVHQGDHYAQVQVYTYTVDYISNYSTDVVSLKGFVTVLR
jgi:gliding motility-associated-like protein